MTKHQQDILDRLKKGDKLCRYSGIGKGVWHWGDKKAVNCVTIWIMRDRGDVKIKEHNGYDLVELP